MDDETFVRLADGSDFALPHGWSVYEPGEIGVTGFRDGAVGEWVGRSPFRVQSENEIRAAFVGALSPRTQLTCDYCEQEFRSRSVESAVQWFHGHECASGIVDLAVA